jgi:uncharacterized protein
MSTEETMAGQTGSEITSDDKLWVLLTYIFTPLIPIIILLIEDKKNRPFIRAHNAQALVLGVISLLIGVLLGWTCILAFVPLLIFIYCIYLGIQGYGGKYNEIPFVTNFCKQQGWA